MKRNCWEIKKCGREPEGKNVDELGICPTTTATNMNVIHGGKNGGRCCWVIAGTMCKGKISGSYAAKMQDCTKCDFYKLVCEEQAEGSDLLGTLPLLKKYFGVANTFSEFDDKEKE